MFRKTIPMVVLAGLSAAAQPTCSVSGKLSLEGSLTLSGLYGGKLSLFKGIVMLKNYCQDEKPFDGVGIDMSMPTTNTMPSEDARQLINRAYDNKGSVKATDDVNAGLGGFGIAVATKAIKIGTGPIGWSIVGAQVATQYGIPLLIKRSGPAPKFGTACDSFLGGAQGTTLRPGESVRCEVYVQKPPKGYPLLPSTLNFALISGAPPPDAAPPTPPVMLRKPVQHEGRLEPMGNPLDSGWSAGMVREEQKLALVGTRGGEWAPVVVAGVKFK